MKLPTYETDHYELDDGEALNREHPDSFWIPDKAVRESLVPGDFVKLIFRMEETAGADDLSVERMWVNVTKKHETLYEGVLDNDPKGSDCVQCGQSVTFHARHVIGIYGKGE
ncbi:DUF2314 domain-containing protein [Pectobacterium actinidiae]|uniref:DUF2314 domain-containing protein n=1 Tax=Pectobacterium actinidiae TaxID=1507808 RepID=A0A1V2R9Q5_9GAMM|nr:DUF2314 domain-containing protein [Pectobacterium actinidiae]KHN90087.1 hypothetical protein KKH3_01140 [Pectobacterium actinidiae]MDY4316763.1 DUF2314 domain-containing protein [Pectobacterium actinidiae]ONK06993.1 DUF2314 domain-containing protein [Pectobacterium actinidiae]ONK09092.1 DUF2314 domain-containing protein [Pectobacterium actinidiae]WEF12465.1 DUF2314 domain-containing protein [Pectobacterium actinidiae]